VDDDVLDSIEEILLTSDVGVPTTLKIIDRLQKRVAVDKFINTSELNKLLKDEVVGLMTENEKAFGNGQSVKQLPKPYVIMVVGVNGVGKTTTIGNLAHQFKLSGRKVILGAADTFRAAAVDQLTIWSNRVGVPIVSQ